MVSFLLVIANLSPAPFNLVNLFFNNHQIIILSFLSFGFMVVFYAGEYDLSTGSTFALCLAVIGVASNNQLSLPLFIILMITLVVLIGGINRYLSKNVTSLLTTFIIMYIIRGVVFIITGGRPLYQDHETDILTMLDWGVKLVPDPLVVLILVTLILSVFFKKSATAQKLIAVGINQKKAYLLDIHLGTYKLAAFIFSASMALFASIFYYTHIYTVSPNAGIVYGFEALAVVIISNGGLKPVSPSPVLVVFTATLITLIIQYSSALDFSTEIISLIVGIFVLISLRLSLIVNPVGDQ